MTDRVIRVTVDASGVARGAAQAQRPLQRLSRRQELLERGFKRLTVAAGGLVAALGARELIRTADTFQRIENQLRIVTDSTEELVTAQSELFDIAQDTRQPLEATVELFSRASIAADELGASEAELFRLTEITGRALAVQGGAASESAGALRQLSQSFSSGIVRAEEFNSLLEGAFPLAQAAARGLDEAGGSVGRLRNLVVAGEVDSREFFDAIIAGAEGIDEAFERTVPTVAQSLTVLRNSFTSLIGRLNQTSGFTQTLSGFILELADDLGIYTDAVLGTLGPTDELGEGMQIITIASVIAANALQSLIDVAKVGGAIFTDIGASIGGAGAGIAAIFRGEFKEGIDILNEPALVRTQEAFTNLFLGVETNTRDASTTINEILIPALRSIREESAGLAETEAVPPIPTNVAKDLEEAKEALEEFRGELIQAETELRLTANAGDEADEAIRQYREALELGAAESEIFGELLPTAEVEELRQTFLTFATDSIAAQRALREEIEAAELSATFDEQIAGLQEEIVLLNADTQALAANAEARALAEGATAEQAARIGELTELLLTERERLKEETDALGEFFGDVSESAQTQLSGILADPLSAGLDELPFKFAQTLQALAGQALASEFFKLITGLFGGPAGGGQGGGGIAGLLSGLLGGGLQAGGPISTGGARLVGERGPELFAAPGSGQIVPNVNVQMAAQEAPMVNIVNVTDPADVAAGIGSPEGEQEVINVIQRNPGAIRRLLG